MEHNSSTSYVMPTDIVVRAANFSRDQEYVEPNRSYMADNYCTQSIEQTLYMLASVLKHKQ